METKIFLVFKLVFCILLTFSLLQFNKILERTENLLEIQKIKIEVEMEKMSLEIRNLKYQ